VILTASVLLVGASSLFAQTVGHPVQLRVESTGGVLLAGALYLPTGDGPFPAVIFTHGSEAGGRSSPGYIRWAERMRDQGIAALIFDKRGVGDSQGSYVEAPDLSVPAADVLAWHELLKRRDDLKADHIGVLGWSQGGWTGPLAASQSDLAFVIMISGPAVSPLEQNIFDKSNQVRRAAPSQAAADSAESAIRVFMTYLVKGGDQDVAQEAWDSVAGETWFADSYPGIPMMDRAGLLADPRGQAFVTHNGYEPLPALQKLRVPVLAVYGGADRIVSAEQSVAILRSAIDPELLTYYVMPGANHGIGVRVAGGGQRNADGYPDNVMTWIGEVVE
jgi:pimeloyl-ACP methyl ester carboxylesterase